MPDPYIIALLVLTVVILLIILFRKQSPELTKRMEALERVITLYKNDLERMDKGFKDEFQRNREEAQKSSRENREELARNLKDFQKTFTDNIDALNGLLRQKFNDFGKLQTEQNRQAAETIRTLGTMLEKQVKGLSDNIEKNLRAIREDNNKQLSEMRQTVDEKLQKTLNARLSQSFETVGKQLEAVQQGLGAMRTLAGDVGGLKKALSNVKMRGGIGEVQLEMLLEQILAPDQYAANVRTKADSSDHVEFAVKLPGKDDRGTAVWLPIDAKFPKDVYEQMQTAYDKGEAAEITQAQKNLKNTIKRMAGEIRDKYLDPPNTTDFGIMFLPFEGIYAEVVRHAALLEELQRDYKTIVTGPATLAAILNSLQMGFRTLAIQKRSSEVWRILGAVKKEFGAFENLMSRAQKNIQTGLNQLDDVMGRRTRAIQRKLKDVQELDSGEAKKILPGMEDSIVDDDE
ncbi:MAG TPA: DNA recombination protein RmuC [Caldithrix abyssi]|uniref:DNA recombination protein RmuC n=1 Tax=Caldithrix abyssi TaxID=187145 RepID=A0A7V1LMS3_CALAY|nr:DNA recombination protein RmuC [Caldithrix abyssi]